MMNQNCLPKGRAFAIRRVVLLLVFALAILASLGMSSVAFADSPGIQCPLGEVPEPVSTGGTWGIYYSWQCAPPRRDPFSPLGQ